MSPRAVFGSMTAKLSLRGCDVVGEDVRTHGRPTIENRGRLEIGPGSVLWSHPVATQLTTGPDGSLLIGASVVIGYGCSIIAKGLVTIGEGAQIGPFAMVCDAEDDGLSGWRHSERPIVIGRGARLGSKVTVLPGTYIGDGVHVPAGSVVSGTVSTDSAGSRSDTAKDRPRTAWTASDGVAPRLEEILARIFNRSPNAPLTLELERISGWGAGSALRLLLAVEHEFNTRIPDDEWLAIRSLGDLVSTIERRMVVSDPVRLALESAATQV